MAVGLFIGVQPLYGLHGGLCALICLPLRLDLVVAFAASNISIPIVAPFILFAEVHLGSFVISGRAADLDLDSIRARGVVESALGLALELGIGSVIFGALVAPLGAALTYWGIRRWRRRNAPEVGA